MQRLEKRWQATALENERYSGGKGMSLKLRSFASLRMTVMLRSLLSLSGVLGGKLDKHVF